MSEFDGSDYGNDPLREDKRRNRNESEKRRRDAFNNLIQQLSGLVSPATKTTPQSATERKLDKSNVLQHTIDFLRLQKTKFENGHTQQHEADDEEKPKDTKISVETKLLMQANNAGIVVISTSGVILFESGLLSNLFAKPPMKNDSFCDLLTNGSREQLQRFLSNEIFLAASSSSKRRNDGGKVHHKFNLDLIVESSEVLTCSITGMITTTYTKENGLNTTTSEAMCFAFVLCPFTSLGVTAAMRLSTQYYHNSSTASQDPIDASFTLKLNHQWRFVVVDQRAQNILGYSEIELLGESGYDLVHLSDLCGLVNEHKQLISNGSVRTAPYRVLTKSGKWLWIKSLCKLDSQTPSSNSYICSCSVVGGDPKAITPPTVNRPMSTSRSITNIERKALKRPRDALRYSIVHSPIQRPTQPINQQNAVITVTPTTGGGGARPAVATVAQPSADELAALSGEERRVWLELQTQALALQQQVYAQQQQLRRIMHMRNGGTGVQSETAPPSVAIQQQYLPPPSSTDVYIVRNPCDSV